MGIKRKPPTQKIQANRIFNRREISKVLSEIESRQGAGILKRTFSKDSFKRSICFTGPAGVGKSTLIANLLQAVGEEKRIAWLACDPSSVISGGSLLGDRIRLAGSRISENIFVRSLSTRSTQAFSPAVRDMEVYLETLFDEVWVETAGSGQTQQEVAKISGLTILVLQPETGDDIQWMKSGIRELADIFVVHKADLKGSELMMKSLIENGVRKDRVVLASSKSKEGLGEFLDLLTKVKSEIKWKNRLLALHFAHARDLFFERSLKAIEVKFERQRASLALNPYV
jgi:LAO/AO transport system kinase